MPSIEIPPTTGVLPTVRVNYGGPLVVPVTYVAQVEVVGTYTEPAGYGYKPEHIVVRHVAWQGDTEHEVITKLKEASY